MQIEKHHAVCPEAEVDCPYKQYGCHVKVLFYRSLSVPGLDFVSQTNQNNWNNQIMSFHNHFCWLSWNTR